MNLFVFLPALILFILLFQTKWAYCGCFGWCENGSEVVVPEEAKTSLNNLKSTEGKDAKTKVDAARHKLHWAENGMGTVEDAERGVHEAERAVEGVKNYSDKSALQKDLQKVRDDFEKIKKKHHTENNASSLATTSSTGDCQRAMSVCTTSQSQTID